MYFCYNGQKLFSYSYYREYNFGQWVPISFAAFRESDITFQLNTAQASILYQNLEIDSNTNDGYGYNHYYYLYIKISQFTITNTLAGLLSDVKIYGIIRHQHEKLGEAKDDIPDSAIVEIDLKSQSKDGCLPANHNFKSTRARISNRVC